MEVATNTPPRAPISSRFVTDALSEPSRLTLLEAIEEARRAGYSGESHWCSRNSPNFDRCFGAFHELVGSPRIEGVEWWLRRRPAARGKELHFDKDEWLARNRAIFTHPLAASVYYLSKVGGATLVVDQTVNLDGMPSPSDPTRGLLSFPKTNGLLVFDGRYRHAVLGTDESGMRATLLMKWWSSRPKGLEHWDTLLEASESLQVSGEADSQPLEWHDGLVELETEVV